MENLPSSPQPSYNNSTPIPGSSPFHKVKGKITSQLEKIKILSITNFDSSVSKETSVELKEKHHISPSSSSIILDSSPQDSRRAKIDNFLHGFWAKVPKELEVKSSSPTPSTVEIAGVPLKKEKVSSSSDSEESVDSVDFSPENTEITEEKLKTMKQIFSKELIIHKDTLKETELEGPIREGYNINVEDFEKNFFREVANQPELFHLYKGQIELTNSIQKKCESYAHSIFKKFPTLEQDPTITKNILFTSLILAIKEVSNYKLSNENLSHFTPEYKAIQPQVSKLEKEIAAINYHLNLTNLEISKLSSDSTLDSSLLHKKITKREEILKGLEEEKVVCEKDREVINNLKKEQENSFNVLIIPLQQALSQVLSLGNFEALSIKNFERAQLFEEFTQTFSEEDYKIFLNTFLESLNVLHSDSDSSKQAQSKSELLGVPEQPDFDKKVNRFEEINHRILEINKERLKPEKAQESESLTQELKTLIQEIEGIEKELAHINDTRKNTNAALLNSIIEEYVERYKANFEKETHPEMDLSNHSTTLKFLAFFIATKAHYEHRFYLEDFLSLYTNEINKKNTLLTQNNISPLMNINSELENKKQMFNYLAPLLEKEFWRGLDFDVSTPKTEEYFYPEKAENATNLNEQT